MKIAIAGYGAEGESNYEYYVAQGGHEIAIADQRTIIDDLPSNVQLIQGSDAFERLQDFDLVVRTASLNPKKIRTNGKIWSATNEFFAKCPAPIVGVTGTKGKGTTSSLIAEILRAAGKTVHVVGNIGVPALGELSKIQSSDIVVYELSSFQLWDLEKSPHVAVILYMEPDHLDVHADMDEYVRAKANIRLHQTMTDICFYHPDNQYVQKIIEMKGDQSVDEFKHKDWRWRAFRYGVNERRDLSIAVAYVEQNVFCIRRPNAERVSTIPTSAMAIPGAYNLQNACAAIDAALVFGVSDEAITQGLSTFKGLPHRLQFIREVGGVKFYDDSIGTTPGSSVAVMQAFEEPKVVIMGGSAKGASFEEAARVASVSNVRAVVVIGEEAPKIEAAMRDRGVLVFNMGGNITMADAVTAAFGQAREGDLVILSPACASFDMFKGYADRGNQFIAAVNAL